MTWTADSVPDQTGRVALVTGANSGIGLEAARVLARRGATVVLGCRNPTRADAARDDIVGSDPDAAVEVLGLDLADLDSVAAAAKEMTSRHDRLDLLINNAGLMATPQGRTAQGFEMQIGVNHLGHFALTAQLLDSIAAGGRVVNISSQGHRPGRIDFDDLNWERRRYSPWPAYFQSKLANLLFTNELQRRLTAADREVMAVAAHPGGSRTNLGHENPGGLINTVVHKVRPLVDNVMLQPADMGALPTLRAATDPDVAGGDYFGPDGFAEQRGHPVKVKMSARANDADVARRLWDVSEELTGVTMPV